LCPFHGEKTPSFTVSRDKQFFHCFGCGAHGSAIGFLMKHRNLEFVEAVEELAGVAGMEVPREARSQRTSGSRDLFARSSSKRAPSYEAQLRQSSEREVAIDYLKKRGLSGEIAKAFPPRLRALGLAQSARHPARRRRQRRNRLNARVSPSSASAAATTIAFANA
jgi:DNA primase